MFCSQCATPLTSDDVYCPTCAKPLASFAFNVADVAQVEPLETPTVVRSPRSAIRRSNGWFFATLGGVSVFGLIVTVGVIGLAAFWFLFLKPSSDSSFGPSNSQLYERGESADEVSRRAQKAINDARRSAETEAPDARPVNSPAPKRTPTPIDIDFERERIDRENSPANTVVNKPVEAVPVVRRCFTSSTFTFTNCESGTCTFANLLLPSGSEVRMRKGRSKVDGKTIKQFGMAIRRFGLRRAT